MSEVTDLISSKLAGLRVRGERLLPNGAQLIFPAPEIAPKAWHFVLFAPLEAAAIKDMEKELDVSFPDDFRDFLKVWNGVKLFGYQVNVWGKRKNYVREGDEAWQPFDLVGHNRRFERPKGSPENLVYVASTERNEKSIFLELNEEKAGRVGSTPHEYYQPDRHWPDFNSWLKSEFNRLWRENYGFGSQRSA